MCVCVEGGCLRGVGWGGTLVSVSKYKHSVVCTTLELFIDLNHSHKHLLSVKRGKERIKEIVGLHRRSSLNKHVISISH